LLIVEAMIAVGAPPPAVTPHLLAMTSSGLPSLRLRSAELLIQSGSPESHGVAVAALASLLGDDRYGIPEAAIKALGAAGPAAGPVAGDLARMLDHRESTLRQETAIALGQIGPAASVALPALRRAADMQRVVDPIGAKPYLDAIALIEK
jgi:HEAT repeat protein